MYDIWLELSLNKLLEVAISALALYLIAMLKMLREKKLKLKLENLKVMLVSKHLLWSGLHFQIRGSPPSVTEP